MKISKSIILTITISTLISVFAVCFAAQGKISANLSRGVITADEHVELILQLQGDTSKTDPDFSVLRKDFVVVGF